MMDLRCTFLVVTSGKPLARSKRIWWPKDAAGAGAGASRGGGAGAAGGEHGWQPAVSMSSIKGLADAAALVGDQALAPDWGS